MSWDDIWDDFGKIKDEVEDKSKKEMDKKADEIEVKSNIWSTGTYSDIWTTADNSNNTEVWSSDINNDTLKEEDEEDFVNWI